MKSIIKLWIRRLVLAAGLILFVAELIRTAVVLMEMDGPGALLNDGVIVFRLGEALVLGAVLALAALSGPLEGPARRSLIERLRWPMWSGALLSILGWWDLRQRAAWSWWPMVLALIGLLSPLLLRRAVQQERRRPGRALAGLVSLLFLAALAHSFLSTGYRFVPAPAAPPPPAEEREDRWRQDLAYLQTELPRMHINAFHSVTREEFTRAAKELEQSLPALEDHEIVVGLMRVAALVGDAHSGISLQPAMGFRRYPLQLAWFQDGLYVFVAAAEHADLIGMRVVGIGGADLESATSAVNELITYENESWLLNQSPNYLVTAEVLHALRLTPSMDQAVFSFEASDGGRIERSLRPLEKESEADWQFANTQEFLFQRNRDLYFWFEYLPENQTLYFKYNACIPFGFWRFNRALWRAVEENPVQKIVVDFRDNGGGSSYQFDFFLNELANHPEFDDPERLFAVTNRSTFSSAMMNAWQMRSQTQATLLGEPTGGKPNSYGEVRAFNLPNSRLRVTYSTRYFQETDEDLPSVMPDVALEMTFADYQAGRDPVLEWLSVEED